MDDVTKEDVNVPDSDNVKEAVSSASEKESVNATDEKDAINSVVEKEAVNSTAANESVNFGTDKEVIKSPDEKDAPNSNDAKENEDSFLKPEFIIPLKKKTIQTNDEQNVSEDRLQPLQEIKAVSKSIKSPSQKLIEKETPIPYKEPPWSGLSPHSYEFEVIKNGVVIDKVFLNKPFLVVGRLSNCDVILEHPSISRYHCIIQYRKEASNDELPGVYVYDLDSTHGTFQNKSRILPTVYTRVRVGHLLKFGGSTRLFILQGPDDDQESEAEMMATLMNNRAKAIKMKVLEVKSKETEKDSDLSLLSNTPQESDSSSKGIDWGMGEDAEEEDEDSEEFQSSFAANEELYLKDPKKTLRGWYEREGFDLPEYQVEEVRPGLFKAKLELPVPGSGKNSITCVVEHKGKKKDAVVQCALEACRTLDGQNLLRQAVHESHEKKRKQWFENDYYDSDEDDFLDRTGDIERKRKLRKKELQAEEIETYQSLGKQYSEVISIIEKLEKNLLSFENLKKKQEKVDSGLSSFSDADEFEEYMSQLSQLPDKHKRIAWKMELVKLGKEEIKLRKLVNLARPFGVPEVLERQSLLAEKLGIADTKKGNSQSSLKESSLIKKTIKMQKVHEAFQEEDEVVKPKLRKVNCLYDDDSDVRPVPYLDPKKTVNKYEEMRSRDRPLKSEKKCLPILENRVNADKESADNQTLNSSNDIHLMESDEKPSEEILVDEISFVEDKSIEEESSLRLPQCKPEKIIEFSKPSLKQIKKKEKLKKEKKSPFNFEEKYEGWVPPKDQSGDGRTALNDKFGY